MDKPENIPLWEWIDCVAAMLIQYLSPGEIHDQEEWFCLQYPDVSAAESAVELLQRLGLVKVEHGDYFLYKKTLDVDYLKKRFAG